MNKEWIAGKLGFSGRLLLTLAVVAGGMVPVFLFALAVQPVRAQATAQKPAANPKDIADTWQGTLHAGRDLRTVVKITKTDGGSYKADFYSIDQGGQPIPVDTVTVDGQTVKMSIKMLGGTFEGKLSGDGKTIDGNWSQGPNPLALTLARATPETEWTIPTPPPPVPAMAADANPSLEVATIKPSDPSRQGKLFTFRGTHFMSINTNLNDLIAFAYGLHSKQIIGAPAWFGTDLYDIDGVPDATGRPNHKQMGIMVQKLLAERCQLKFHHDQRELSVYAISVASGGSKLTRTAAGANDPPSFLFRGLGGDLIVRNMNMAILRPGCSRP